MGERPVYIVLGYCRRCTYRTNPLQALQACALHSDCGRGTPVVPGVHDSQEPVPRLDLDGHHACTAGGRHRGSEHLQQSCVAIYIALLN